MKTLARHEHWIYQIHLPIIVFIASCLLYAPSIILNTLSSPWLWGIFCVCGLGKRSPSNSEKSWPLWQAWLVTWTMQLALTTSLEASQIFNQNLFALPPQSCIAEATPWLYAATIALIARLNRSQQHNLRLHEHIGPWFKDEIAILCTRQFIQIITQFSVTWVYLPLIFCAIFFGYQELHAGKTLAPSLNSVILFLPFLHFAKRSRWQRHFQQLLASGVPLWALSLIALSIIVFVILMLQPLVEMFFIVDKVIPPWLYQIIHESPWPAPLPQLSGKAWHWLWWMVWSWPLAACLVKLYKGRHFAWLLLGLGLGQWALTMLPHTLTPSLAAWYVLTATPILWRMVLPIPTYRALISAELPVGKTSKARNVGRQLHYNHLSLTCIIIFMLTFGMDWSTWVLFTACIPGITMIIITVIQRLWYPTR